MSLQLKTTMFSIIAAASVLGSAAHTHAQTAPSPEDIIKALQATPDRGVAAGPQSATDSDSDEDALISALKQKAARGLSVDEVEGQQLAAVLPSKPRIDLEINFDVNSAEVTEETRPVVMALGRALQSDDLKGATFVIAGHTDRSGSANYNKVLSERRAESIKQYLISKFNMSSEQLIVVGYGQERPKNSQNPYAAENRRAEIVNVKAPAVASRK